ncbi:MAG: hypothetical protein WDN46_21325 [Methylocella sp.]
MLTESRPIEIAKIESLAERLFQGELDLFITRRDGWGLPPAELRRLYKEARAEAKAKKTWEHCAHLAFVIVWAEESDLEGGTQRRARPAAAALSAARLANPRDDPDPKMLRLANT